MDLLQVICIGHKTNIQCFLQINHLHSRDVVENTYELAISWVYILSDKLLSHMGKDQEMLILQNHHPIINTLGYYFLQEHIDKFNSPSYQFEPLLAMDHLLVLVINPMQPDLQLILYLSHLLLLPQFLLHPHFLILKTHYYHYFVQIGYFSLWFPHQM